jgi:thiosulfate dehydrogenase
VARRFVALFVASVAAGCSSEKIEEVTPEERGARLASDPTLSTSRFNAFACTTCHSIGAPPAGRIFTGAPLGGAVSRPHFWGGKVLTLSESVDLCLHRFMRSDPLDKNSVEGRALYAWLASIAAQGPREAWPFTVVLATADLPKGDAAAGKVVYESGCIGCHGALHTAQGGLVSPAGELEASNGPDIVRQVTIEKIRHGGFLGFGGFMAPYSKEALTDQQVADVVTYIGFYP